MPVGSGYIIEERQGKPPRRGFRRRVWLPYEVVKSLVNRYAPHITSKRQFLAWHEDVNATFVPKYPYDVYEGFSWKHFLDVENATPIEVALNKRKRGITFRPIWEGVKFAQRYCREHKISTVRQWKKHYDHAEDIPNDIPKYPHVEYGKDFPGYKAWLGKELTAVLDVEANVESIVTLCHVVSESPNVVQLRVWSGGLSDLRTHWGTSGYDKIYGQWQYERELMPDVNRILAGNGSENGGLWTISNMNQLLWDLNSTLMIVR